MALSSDSCGWKYQWKCWIWVWTTYLQIAKCGRWYQ